MRLYELFDYKADNWVKTISTFDKEFYETNIGDDHIELMYQSSGSSSSDYTFAFKRNGKTTQTHEGNANKIFSAVINHMLEWVEEKRPNTLIFSGDKSKSDSRASLYSRMLDRYTNKLGYRVETEDLGSAVYFVLVKINKMHKYITSRRLL